MLQSKHAYMLWHSKAAHGTACSMSLEVVRTIFNNSNLKDKAETEILQKENTKTIIIQVHKK